MGNTYRVELGYFNENDKQQVAETIIYCDKKTAQESYNTLRNLLKPRLYVYLFENDIILSGCVYPYTK